MPEVALRAHARAWIRFFIGAAILFPYNRSSSDFFCHQWARARARIPFRAQIIAAEGANLKISNINAFDRFVISAVLSASFRSFIVLSPFCFSHIHISFQACSKYNAVQLKRGMDSLLFSTFYLLEICSKIERCKRITKKEELADM